MRWPVLLLAFACNDEGVDPFDPADTDVDELVESLAMPLVPTVEASSFRSAESCAQCHPVHVGQWQTSQHAYAMTDPLFRELSRVRQAQYGGLEDRFCQQCHSSIGTRSGEIKPGFDYDALSPIALEGVTCESCHKVSALERPFNSGHVLDEHGPVRGTIEDPVATPFHASAYSELHGESQFCAGCHDVIETNGLDLERPYQEWLESPAADDGRTCQSCHMPTTTGPAAVGGPTRELHDHSWWSVDLPLAEDFLDDLTYSAKRDVVAETLRASASSETLRASASLEIDAPPEWSHGGTFDLLLTVHNEIDGHAFPTGSTFNRQVWLEVIVRDGEGSVLYETGTLDELGDLRDFYSERDPFGDEDLITPSSTLSDLHGDPTWLVWDALEHTSGALSPGYERTWTVFIPTAASATDEVFIEARLLFRQLPPYLLRGVGLDRYVERLQVFEVSSDALSVTLR
jgi:hypothetical protein